MAVYRLCVAASALALSLAGCRAKPASCCDKAPLGPGPEIRLGVPGTGASSLAVAARDRYVAIAWLAGRSDGRVGVYVSVSADNAGTFSSPVRVDRASTSERDDAAGSLRLAIDRGSPAGGGDGRPEIAIEWAVWHGTRLDRRSARSTDGGRSFAADPPDRVQLFYTGNLPFVSRADVVTLGDGQVKAIDGVIDGDMTLVVAWEESDGRRSRVGMRRIIPGPSGSQTAMASLALSGQESSSQPVVASVLGGVVVAWLSGDPRSPAIALRRVGLDTWCATPEPEPRPGSEGSHHE